MKNEKLEKFDPNGQNVKYNGKMLVFPDPISFMSTLQSIAKANQDCPEINEVKIFQKFENHFNGFYSLRNKIAGEVATMEEKEGITEKNDPELKYNPDPYVQTVLNEDEEVMVSGKIVRITKKGMFEVESKSKEITDLTPESAKKSCCWFIHQRVNWKAYQNNPNWKIKSTIWVNGFNFWGMVFLMVGGKTRHYEKNWLGHWVSRIPWKLSIFGNYTFKYLTCDNINQNSRTLGGNYKYQAREVSQVNFEVSGGIPSFVTEFKTVHRGNHNYDDAYAYLDICK